MPSDRVLGTTVGGVGTSADRQKKGEGIFWLAGGAVVVGRCQGLGECLQEVMAG